MNKILIIEDDPAILIGLEEYLTSNGYWVIKSIDGQAGLDLALNEAPDLILLDINLPTLNGLQICRMLREKNFRNPIIMLTSMTERIDKVVGLEVGANDYVTKPFDSRELLARIRANLRYVEKNIPVDKSNSETGTKDTLQRHLLAVMFTDMEGYSKKMHKDETHALDLLKIHNRIMKEIIDKCEGNIIEIIGDAFLVSFESVIKSVNCAIEIQNRFKEYNRDREKKEKIKIRIGIHLGDLIEFEGKLKGDSLNIASRIQAMAEGGRVYVSGSVYLAVRSKIKNSFHEIGEHKLKNIKEPVNIYEVVF